MVSWGRRGEGEGEAGDGAEEGRGGGLVGWWVEGGEIGGWVC